MAAPLSSEKPIEVTGWPEQVAALACTLNGEPTAAPADGLATAIPEVLAEEAEEPEEPEEPVEPEEPEDPEEPEADPEPDGCAAVEALPPQPTLTSIRMASKETAIDKYLNCFNGKSFDKLGYVSLSACTAHCLAPNSRLRRSKAGKHRDPDRPDSVFSLRFDRWQPVHEL
ncbi:MAG TPA: hypothetical protein VKU93_02915 [Terracidiphilus sp.]|nr:hypothetical protein [Terracidiphilus sp.]